MPDLQVADPNSEKTRMKRARRVSYTALLSYMKKYAGFTGNSREFKKLIEDAGHRLMRKKSNQYKFQMFRQVTARRILELHYSRMGAKEIRRRRRAAKR